ncbi:DUF4302 domain-containing protein [Sphingobacterium faecale]|uniref:DUF4302 domain-containing protein n=1 Tax=Sphingobacterium faecale TaxID=2803775 RepID=A0ABS1R8Y8_9SPHI|nr:DUF4302 domain-containing protein [Sphingobacterium faecale]MBL1410709.1 DUF4302 domain-containing protein [Sphingobacterium faecale]
MRTSLIFGILVIVSLLSCQKVEVEQLMQAAPEQRIKDSVDFIKKSLQSAPYGWHGGIGTSARGGYGFYIKFDADNTLQMLSDYSVVSGNTVQSSTYRVAATSVPSLLFDTYNYISLMQDPVPGVAGGTASSGYKSDVEYMYRMTAGDTLVFEGRKYKNPLMLVKNTQAQQELFLNKGFNTYKNTFSQLYDGYKFTYIENETQVLAIELDLAAKLARFSLIDKSNKSLSSSVNSAFYFSEHNANLVIPIVFGKKRIIGLSIKDNKLSINYSDGTVDEVRQQDTPTYSIESVFDYNKTFKRILSTVVPGVSANQHIFSAVRTAFSGTGRTISSMYFAFTSSTNLNFYIGYSNATTSFNAQANYTYRREGNKIFIKRANTNGNWDSRVAELTAVNNFFGTGEEREFTLEWVSSTDASVKYPIAAIRSATNNMNMLYGKLGE